ncbi:MAG: hypothetical protein ACLFR0_05630 [Alphaproteobacteria bacterium]
MIAEYAYLAFCVICAACGVYLIIMALLWREGKRFARAEIIGFLKKRSRLKKLPVVEFEDEGGFKVKSKVIVIDSLSYWIKPAQKGDSVSVLYFLKEPEKCLVHGYMNLIGGFLLLWPLLFYAAVTYLDPLNLTRFAFILVFIGVLAVMWLFLRLVRYYY